MSQETAKPGPVPIEEGLFILPSASPDGKPHLVGNKCRSCGEVFFPARVACRRCSSRDMEEHIFPPTGKLYAFTTNHVRIPHCILPTPYMAGQVELEGGERVKTLLTDCDESSLEIGADVELVIEPIGKMVERMGNIEPGTEVLGWKFRPARGQKR